MIHIESKYLLVCSREFDPSVRLRNIDLIGGKACGLCLLPENWTPPFFVVSTLSFRRWKASDDKSQFLSVVSGSIFEKCTSKFFEGWSRGLMIRSSSVQESLAERGAYETFEMPADYDVTSIKSALLKLYQSFCDSGAPGEIAAVVQARAKTLSLGHASNERRVSATENHWSWEIELSGESAQRFNSQRAIPDEATRLFPISISRRSLSSKLKEVARWCTNLKQGRIHIEWGLSERNLWIYQLDFENDQPDPGIDPRRLLRGASFSGSTSLSLHSKLRPVDLATSTGWRKIDNAQIFANVRSARYPQLYFVLGHDMVDGNFNRAQLIDDVQSVTQGRAVCRTDCSAASVPRLNLPRTDSVSAEAAVDFMFAQLGGDQLRGASPEQVCFIVHRFIPSCVAVWALAQPENQVVLVDAIWGLPDGLQYLNHDSFEFDTARDEVSAEYIRYKPLFLQETISGQWELVRVARDLTRGRCLTRNDLREVARQSRKIARDVKKSVQIMWFCEIDERLGVGRNVPWFMMNAEEPGKRSKNTSLAPGAVIVNVSSLADLEGLSAFDYGRCALRLTPDAKLFRDDHFIKEVARAAKERRCPVIMTGSILSHAFYILEREDVSVITSSSSRTRTRQRQVFRKLVRDEIPSRIVEQGERVVTARIPKFESRAALVVKLMEEAQELLNAATPQEVTGELADLVEVVRAISTATGVDWDDVQKAADLKRKSRGSFEHNVVLMETSWPTLSSPPSSAGPPTILLKDLGQMTVNKDITTLAFVNVIAKGGDNVATLSDGTSIEVSMSTNGLRFRRVETTKNLRNAQLEFVF